MQSASINTDWSSIKKSNYIFICFCKKITIKVRFFLLNTNIVDCFVRFIASNVLVIVQNASWTTMMPFFSLSLVFFILFSFFCTVFFVIDFIYYLLLRKYKAYVGNSQQAFRHLRTGHIFAGRLLTLHVKSILDFKYKDYTFMLQFFFSCLFFRCTFIRLHFIRYFIHSSLFTIPLHVDSVNNNWTI